MKRVKIYSGKRSKELEQILQISGQRIQDCIQCGKCSASCPASEGMDILPHQVIRLLQTGELDKVIESKTIWSCASCFTCFERCPRDIDIANVLEAVRLIVIRRSGENRIKAEDVLKKIDNKMPQQAIVSVFRKYNK
ncbi:4Fe-4S dicluster domain-containing protein [Clostridium estertheticum]|uniref:4Fe-4S dicluster domain-containing protein n=1 Tax=Clostridium estertheticum TaxID=238834 RepID=UPI001C7CA547|nr:4Fe-4S dicluster domain-containing protein [Clostridium estertheticum]MBX4265933.1 4Fe-4S dicluster domain-containing protein [Clostridium estertheticum]MBX4268670.1 4Fe-4S dicluster domain-containing protein [Clostridium estertheticum]WLC79127.1 4Fe-4S dicluster domain-containing protein [Clostridium estertheticum]WLC90146.1 4Fe-4S dicluster domain-containing protein [Clostridium estertheticum]